MINYVLIPGSLGLKDFYEHSLKKGSLEEQALYFNWMQNALLVKNAESYYRHLFESGISTWNIRDQHMLDCLVNIDQHISQQKKSPAKIVFWAHNSHIGDARATEMGQQGEHNLGQLARQEYGQACSIIGLTTYEGFVTAAAQWGQALLLPISR